MATRKTAKKQAAKKEAEPISKPTDPESSQGVDLDKEMTPAESRARLLKLGREKTKTAKLKALARKNPVVKELVAENQALRAENKALKAEKLEATE